MNVQISVVSSANLSLPRIAQVLALANSTGAEGNTDTANRIKGTQHALKQTAGYIPVLWFELLVSLLINSEGERVLLELNPFLDADQAADVLHMTAAILLVRSNSVSGNASGWSCLACRR